MPIPYIQKIAKKKKISIEKAESYWDKAKELAAKEDHEDDYAYITGVFKHMIGERLSFKEFCNILEMDVPANSVAKGGTAHHDASDGVPKKRTIIRRKRKKKKHKKRV